VNLFDRVDQRRDGLGKLMCMASPRTLMPG
jgi:hypothetical protein